MYFSNMLYTKYATPWQRRFSPLKTLLTQPVCMFYRVINSFTQCVHVAFKVNMKLIEFIVCVMHVNCYESIAEPNHKHN